MIVKTLSSIIGSSSLHARRAWPGTHHYSSVACFTLRFAPVRHQFVIFDPIKFIGDARDVFAISDVRYFIMGRRCIVTSSFSFLWLLAPSHPPWYAITWKICVQSAPKCLAVFPTPFRNTMPNFRANGSAVAEKNGNGQTNTSSRKTHWTQKH